jgi:hypothetical protein
MLATIRRYIVAIRARRVEPAPPEKACLGLRPPSADPSVDLPQPTRPVSNSLFAEAFESGVMPVYEVPDVVEVELDQLELPAAVPVDAEFNEKPLSACTKTEVDEALKAFSGVVLHSQHEIETIIEKHIEFRRRIAHLQAYREHFDKISWVRKPAQGG